MKIGYLMNSYPMTSTTFIRREIEALEALNVEVKRYAVRPWDQPLVDSLDIVEAERTRYLLVGKRMLGSLLSALLTNLYGIARAIGPWIRQIRNGDGGIVRHCAYLLEAIVLHRLTRRDGIAHLHVHFSTNSTAVAMLSKLMGGPSYSFTAHGPDEFGDRTSGSLDLKMAHATFVVAISRFCKGKLIALGGQEFSEKIHIVRCGLRLEDFAADSSRADDNETLVCVGRLCLQKGQLLLPAAAAALRPQFPSLRIVLIGDGPVREELEKLIREHAVGEMFELKGWQSNVEVRNAVRKARAFLLPSSAEGLPVVIMEALALERPVISTSVAGIPELVDQECGWIVSPGSESELVAAIRSALTADATKLRQLGLEGHRRITEQHDIKKSAQRLFELFSAAHTIS